MTENNPNNLPAPIDDTALRGVTDELVAKVEALVIVDQAGLTYASELLGGVTELRRNVNEHYNGVIAEADHHHKALIALKRVWTDRLDAIDRALRPKMSAYVDAVERERTEKLRLAELNRKRIESVADKAVDRAHDLIDDGKSAASVLDRAADRIETLKAEAPVVPPAPVAEGVSFREVWKFEVVSPELVPRKFLSVDEKRIREYVHFMKHQAEIPGVHIWSEKAVAVAGTRSKA